MKKLRLPLKKQWFEMTKAGIKTEDYREINPYWAQRLVGAYEWSTIWRLEEEEKGNINAKYLIRSFAEFDTNVMTLGYPKSTDTERILRLEHKGIEIRTGNPEWGAEPNKLYFVIKHGVVLQ